MNHHCNKEKDIAIMSEKVRKIEKALFDNGQKGLITTTIQLDENVRNMTDTVKALTTAVSGLTQFRDETIGGIKAKERMKINSRWLIGLLISTVIGLLTIIIV
jgi:hypothetical protein